MEHKAFVFEWSAFVRELADILEKAIFCQQSHELIVFINNNLQYLISHSRNQYSIGIGLLFLQPRNGTL
jgi:hypothetical protein